MKLYSFNAFRLLALSAIVLTIWSCTKEKVSTPVSQKTSSVTSDDALQPGENTVDTLVPGTYAITKFIDSSVDHTSQFNGYTFEFQDDRDLIATKGANKYNGRWRLNAAETKMAINITGTAALDDLDGTDWNVAKLTDHTIIIKRKGPDKVVFKM